MSDNLKIEDRTSSAELGECSKISKNKDKQDSSSQNMSVKCITNILSSNLFKNSSIKTINALDSLITCKTLNLILISNKFMNDIQNIIFPENSKKYDFLHDTIEEGIRTKLIDEMITEIKKIKEINILNEKKEEINKEYLNLVSELKKTITEMSDNLKIYQEKNQKLFEQVLSFQEETNKLKEQIKLLNNNINGKFPNPKEDKSNKNKTKDNFFNQNIKPINHQDINPIINSNNKSNNYNINLDMDKKVKDLPAIIIQNNLKLGPKKPNVNRHLSAFTPNKSEKSYKLIKKNDLDNLDNAFISNDLNQLKKRKNKN